jgi:hypothetical protein
VLGAVILGSCGALCGTVVGVRVGALNDAAWFLILLAALFGLVGFVGGIAGAILGLSGHAPQLSAPPALVAIMTGVVQGGVALGGLGLLLGSCVAAFVYQSLSNSYCSFT